jgi:hypothetical protein
MHPCPSHDDGSPSLSVRRSSAGDWLVHCFGGCRTDDVLAAAGLRWSDLFACPRASTPRRPESPLIEARRDVLRIAQRHAWAHDLYFAADALRFADRVRASVAVDNDDAWELLAQCAALTREAEALSELMVPTA